MVKKESKEKVKELEKEIRRHNRLYFEKQAPEISDTAFDRLVEQLKKLNPDSTALSEIPSDRRVEGSSFNPVTHTSPMLSLDKCYSMEDFQSWAEKFEGELVASPKIDGLAVELRYDETGKLVLAATRGNGVTGDDITENVRMVKDIPGKISVGANLVFAQKRGRSQGSPLQNIEIRGEIYMPLSVFKKFKEEFANPRNLAAGAVKQKDPRRTKEYQLSFFG
ncbi:MAG: hypothetical protein Q7S00_06865, partial [bacterium]|nr:hypothetical protein [bacterium]